MRMPLAKPPRIDQEEGKCSQRSPSLAKLVSTCNPTAFPKSQVVQENVPIQIGYGIKEKPTTLHIRVFDLRAERGDHVASKIPKIASKTRLRKHLR
jgi:hypothetical protein